MKKRLSIILGALFLFIAADRVIGLVINIGLEKYFGLNTPAKVLLVGHSHLMLATNKEGLEKSLGYPVAKYCREGVNVADRYEMVKHYLNTRYADSLRVVLYGVDQFMFTGAGLSANSYKLFYPFMDDSVMNQYIKQSAEPLDYWQHKLICTTRYSDPLLNSSIRGWLSNWSNYKYGHLDVEKLKDDLIQGKQRHIDFDRSLIVEFEQTLQLLTERGISVILVNTPIAKPLNDNEPQAYDKIINYFKDLAVKNDSVFYLDYNPKYSEQYELFFDPIHLNPLGQKVISENLESYLKLRL